MLAKDLIDRLERLGLLDQEIIEALRQQLEQGGSRVTPEAVAKLLVDNGQLTSFQASKLIGELRSGQYEDEAAEVEEVDLTAGIDIPGGEPDAVEVFDGEIMEAEAVAVEAVPVDGYSEEAVAVEAVPVDAVSMEGDGGSTPRPNRPQPARKRPEANKSVWDSFKIYGYVGIIVLLLLTGGALFFLLSRESADAVIENANQIYDQQNYEAAQARYIGYLDTFGNEDQFASLARTRIVMTRLYKAAAFKQEPEKAVQEAKELLPAIAEEEGMNEERANLASLLVDIAANITNIADKAKETSKKEMLLATLDEHRELMDNPLYMTSAMRVTLAGQIKAVEEDYERVQRDINRNKRLDATEAAMIQFLEESKTKDAYDARKELLRDFPELTDDERLLVLIRQASEIQQGLVTKARDLPELLPVENAEDQVPSIILTSLKGKDAPDLRGQTLYLRAGGSVIAFDGATGKLKWRRFVGYSDDLPPVRIGDGRGVLLSDSSEYEVLRCDADSGDVVWRCKIGEPFSEPVVVKDDVFVTADSGRVFAVDTESGDSTWAMQVPQALETQPCVERRVIYQPGNHSNLYVINARDGACLESFYIGHTEGTISVPPVMISGYLFVIENAGTDYAIIHVLKSDESGKNLVEAQDPFRISGNVRVTPIIQNQRLIVLSDLGGVTVFEVELAAEGDQVSVGATLPPFYESPTPTQMAVGGRAMWITGTRVGRYKLQVSTGQVIRDWSLHELDRFIGRPYVGDDTLVYSRILRGTSAIRVTAADSKSGEEIWRTDVGVPVAAIKAKQGGGFHAITSQAGLFDLDREALSSGSTKSPVENPGAQSVNIRFEHPVPLDDGRIAFLDQGGGESVLVYNPSREYEKLRLVTMRLPAGRPSGGMVFSSKGLVIPLTSGRAVWANWQTGAVGATPFQPSSDPAGSVQWTQPVSDADDSSLIVVADSRKKIYRLRVNERIRELASRDLQKSFLGPAARFQNTFFATVSGPAADFLVGHDMESLEENVKLLLPGRVVWGPVATSRHCLLQTDDGRLRAYDASGKELFATPLPAGKPIGQPVVLDESFVLAGSSGWLVNVNTGDGALLGTSDLGQPISGTPIQAGKSLLVPGAEGVIYISDVPSK